MVSFCYRWFPGTVLVAPLVARWRFSGREFDSLRCATLAICDKLRIFAILFQIQSETLRDERAWGGSSVTFVALEVARLHAYPKFTCLPKVKAQQDSTAASRGRPFS